MIVRELALFSGSTAALVMGALLLASWSPPVVAGDGDARPTMALPVSSELAPSSPTAALPRPVASYTLVATLDPQTHVIEGSGTIRFLNSSRAPLSSIWLHLYLNAFAHSDTLFAKKSSAGFRGEDGPFDPGSIDVESLRLREHDGHELWPSARFPDDPDRTDVEVPLPRAIQPGETVHFDVRFRSKLPEVVLRTGYRDSFHMVAQWFPKLAKLEPDGRFAHFPFHRFSEFYADFGDYDVSIETPEAFRVAAPGDEIESRVDAGTRTTRHRLDGVIDFAFAAWDRWQTQTVEGGAAPIACFYPEGEDRAASRQLEAARRGLSWFGEALGPYPHERLVIVHPPSTASEAGGMEYPGLITTGAMDLPIEVPVRTDEILTLHELAHQWFMGIVATDEHSHPFLDEGLTTYVSGLALEELYDGGVAPDVGFFVGIGAFERAVQLGAFAAAPVASPSAGFERGGDYGALVYQRTATILRTLDAVYDRAGARALHDYARRERFAHPGPSALQAAVRRAGGPEAERFFVAAIFERASLDYAIESLDPPVITRRGELRLPTTVELVDPSGRRVSIEVPIESLDAPLAVPDGFVVEAACVDPEQRLLVDEARTNDCLARSPRGFSPRGLSAGTLLPAIALGALLP
jgi:hypothetical protein